MSVSAAAAFIQLAVFNPGAGVEPPGQASTGLHTIMSWTAAVALSIVVMTLIGAGVKLGAAYFGHGEPRVGALGYILGGALLITGASGLVTALTGA